MSTMTKSDRIQIRVDEFAKNKIERAARVSHKSVSEFVISNAIAAADKLLKDHDQVALSSRDWELFYAAILNPPKPNKALRAAFKRYKSQQGK
jgi:uncharacterized protein (DUF1778 family)